MIRYIEIPDLSATPVMEINSPKYGIKKVLIDSDDIEKVKAHTWFVNKHRDIFYVRTHATINNVRTLLRLHRFIMDARPGEIVDHINGNGLDNRKCNLRICSLQENNHNCKKPRHNTSGYKGVYWHKLCKKWGAQIRVNKKELHLGLFDTKEKAYDAYCEASKKYHGEFGRTA